ncbi:FAD-dependent oxidoreductase [Plantactinospora endophytica]|uniref:FAD-dependent oxidoreductase n=1 Tax=Plantactinospora endophytica TaxID=673535 RepID=A0ABQ4DW64_9ACTN|nr:FAD-dependent oxidoreductase [Plantactinospora endophytica]
MGGGIAGTLSAIALRKAGIGSVVYEAYDRDADNVGAFLTLAVNALDALQTLDIDVRRIGFETPKMALTSGSGKKLGELQYGAPLPDGTVSRTVKRADLYRLLREHAERLGVRIEYGKRLVEAESDGDRVLARFADGSTAEGDLLIGADGLWSRTREIIDPDAPGVRYSGLLNTGGYAHGVRTDAEPGVMCAIFGRYAFFMHLTHPDGEVWWAANPARKVEPTRAELSAISPQEWRAHLLELFRHDDGPAADLIAASDKIFSAWKTYDVPTVPRWHRNRMIVIGDAAHATAPSIGQGAGMAIEDTVVLAKCLRDSPDVSSAFTAYERLRRERVQRVVAQGNRTGGWKGLGPVARIPRDFIMAAALKRMARRGEDPSRWIYDYRIDWDQPVRAGTCPVEAGPWRVHRRL